MLTTLSASQGEGAEQAMNGIPDKHPVDSDEIRKELRQGHPSGVEQKEAADQVIALVERKPARASCDELLTWYGYGTVAVSMLLWFEAAPDDPFLGEESGRGLPDVNRSAAAGGRAGRAANGRIVAAAQLD